MKLKKEDQLVFVEHDPNSEHQGWRVGDLATCVRGSHDFCDKWWVTAKRVRDGYQNDYLAKCFKPAFTQGQEVTGDQIKLAMEAGWVLKAVAPSTTVWYKSGDKLVDERGGGLMVPPRRCSLRER